MKLSAPVARAYERPSPVTLPSGERHWLITDKGDPDARALVDGEVTTGIPHYSRQSPGSRLFTRNGQNLVFITEDKLAVWVTFRPTPGKATRSDKLDAWECALFRNDGPYKSSVLIREAVLLSCAIWGGSAERRIYHIRQAGVSANRDSGLLLQARRMAEGRTLFGRKTTASSPSPRPDSSLGSVAVRRQSRRQTSHRTGRLEWLSSM